MMRHDRRVPPRIEAGRLLLRRMVETDADALLDAVETSRAELERWMHWPTRMRAVDARAAASSALEEATSWQRGMFRRDDGSRIGGNATRVLRADVPSFALAYWLRTSATGHGSMREAVRALTGILFDGLGARRVVIGCDPDNLRSARVAEACGFVFEARLRNEIVYPGNVVRDLLVYSMVDTDDAARALAVVMPMVLDDPKPEET